MHRQSGIHHFMKKIASGVLVLSLIMALFTPMNIYAKETKQTRVRVGWYQSGLFQEGASDDEPKSGYAYEYLQKIASYTGWEYEYVYGDWPELLEMLRQGEIDVMGGVSDTAEREDYLSYPSSPMGTDHYCLYQRMGSNAMKVTDPSSFSGKRIGTLYDNLMTDYLEQWASDNQFDVEIVYFNSFEERDEALVKNELDGLVATDNNIMNNSGFSMVAKVGEEPYYLAVTKSREDLLEQLNDALALMEVVEPLYVQNQEAIYYVDNLKTTTMTPLETEWLEEHEVLTIGYLESYLPYCDTGIYGKATGLMVDVVTEMIDHLGLTESLQVKYRGYQSYDDLRQDLIDEKIDVAFPVGGSAWNLDEDDIDASVEVISASMALAYRGSYEKMENPVFAVNKNNKLQYYYTKNYYPNSEIIEVDSLEECLDAVNLGFADYTVVNGLRTNYVHSDKYAQLSLMQLQGNDTRSFGVKRGNTGVLLILNRGLRLIGSDFAINASYLYMEQDREVTLIDFIRSNLSGFLMLTLLLIVVILAIFLLYIRASKKAQQKMKEASQAKTVFLNNMSHDIRTPMNAILGFTNLIEKKKDDPEAVADYVKKIKISGEYLLSIINNVLDMARIESGKATVDEAVMDLLSEESKVLSNIQEMAKKKNQKFTMENTIQHRYVMVDAAKQQEIMMNLLSNAIKYTPEDGEIQMNMYELPCNKPGYGTYQLIVKDNGIGMSEDYLEHIFDSFSRERNTTESKVIGTGLGMSIVKKLVDLLGGTIEVESEVGKGTTFTVTFTHKIVEAPELIPQKTVYADKVKGKRVLLAEDNELNAEIAMEILGDLGIEVERVSDGIECINTVLTKDSDYFDLILMDIQMPNLNGYDATSRIRELPDEERANIPIFAMTANAFEEDKQMAYMAGMNGHIAKPINLDELIETISTVL